MAKNDRNTIMLDWDPSVDLYWWTCTCTRGPLGRTSYDEAMRRINKHTETAHGGEVDLRHGDLMPYADLDGQ